MAEEVTIVIPGLLITFKSAAWGARQKEQHLEAQQAIIAPKQRTRLN